jgi:hypothetical protein
MMTRDEAHDLVCRVFDHIPPGISSEHFVYLIASLIWGVSDSQEHAAYMMAGVIASLAHLGEVETAERRRPN